MTTTHEKHEPKAEPAETPRAARIGLTNLEQAEHRRRIAEIVYFNAKAKAEIAAREAELESPIITPRETAAKKLAIAKIAYESAELKHEAAMLKIALAEDKAAFPR